MQKYVQDAWRITPNGNLKAFGKRAKVGRYDTGGADFEGESFDVSGVLLICYLDIVYCNLFAENV